MTPLCIHRAPLGTHDRFIGFLIEPDAILAVIETSQQHGVSVRRSCLILAIEHRRVKSDDGTGSGGAYNGNSKAPVRKDLTGANPRWCWDISYLMTFQKGVYLYLYLQRAANQHPAYAVADVFADSLIAV